MRSDSAQNCVLDGAQGQLLEEKSCPVMPDDTLPCAVQKWLNRSICRLGCGLWWAEGSTSSIVFARWRQCVVASSVCRSVTLVSPAKTAKTIEMPFALCHYGLGWAQGIMSYMGVQSAEGRCHGNQFLDFYKYGAHCRHLANKTEPFCAAMWP